MVSSIVVEDEEERREGAAELFVAPESMARPLPS